MKNRLAALFALLVLILPAAALAGGFTARENSAAPAGSEGAGDVGRLIGLLGSPDSMERSQARYALVNIGEKAVPELIKALQARESLSEIVYILNSIKDERAAGPLAGLLDLPEGVELARVKSALYSLGDASVPYLFDALSDPARRVSAAAVLADMKPREYYTSIYPYLKDKDALTRRWAASVERSWLDKGASGLMAGLLEDPEAEVRREASAYFLALSPDVETPGLKRLLADADADVRVDALKIALKTRDTALVDDYIKIMDLDPSPEARLAAGEALMKTAPEKAVEPSLRALKDKDDSVAAAAAIRLGELNRAEAAVPIQELLAGREKPSDEIVEAVARSLTDIGAKYDPNILLPHVNWENLYVVRSVIRAWEITARPTDEAIKAALRRYLEMPVDSRYKEHVKALLERLG